MRHPLAAPLDLVRVLAQQPDAQVGFQPVWCTQPQYVYRHEWQVGDLLIWSNMGTMHRALPYPLDSGRLMHRTILAGEEPLH